jgi:hypothetical protein
MSSNDNKGGAGKTDRQPEALRTFEAAGRSGGEKPDEQGLKARPETAPLPDSNERKAETATRVLQAGVDKNPKAATKAVQDSKDPRLPR